MSTEHVDHLLIGGGIATVACAEALREAGAEGSIVIICRELDTPYHRPPATKGYLRGIETLEESLIKPEAWYAEHDIELRTRTNVKSIDTQSRTVEVMKADPITYGTCLVATGAQIKRLKLDGDRLKGSHYVRSLRNADAIGRDMESARSAVIIGGSFIGCEAAASLTDAGKTCTIVMLEDEPMERAFGATVGGWVRKLLEGRGVEIVSGEGVERFEGDDERIQKVVTGSGTSLDADFVVLGTGATPDVMLANQSGLEIGESGGVKCSAKLETSAAGVYAAGDMCEYESVLHGRAMRIEHEEHAAAQGRTVAANMLGGDRDHDEVPYFWTDISDWATIESVGPAEDWDEEIVRGSVADGEFAVLYVKGGKLVGAVSVNRRKDLDAAVEIIKAGGDLPEHAADAGTALA